VPAVSTVDTKGSLQIPVSLNVLLFTGIGAVQLAFLWGPALWAGRGWLSAAALGIFAWSAYLLWGLIHESIHGLLHTHRGVNRGVGRALSILHGCPLRVVRTEHLLHHRYNRVEDQPELYDPKRTTWGKEAVRYYFSIVCGFYFMAQVMCNLLVWLPSRWRTRFLLAFTPGPNYSTQFDAALTKHLGEARLDACAVIALYAVSAWMFRDALTSFALLCLVRAFVISLMDYAYHYGTPLNASDNPSPAKNLTVGAPWLILNFNHHAVHHAHPSVPWRWLPAVAKAQKAVFHGPLLAATLKQFAGPIAADRLPGHAPLHPT
jgi:fatty acid desaturase